MIPIVHQGKRKQSQANQNPEEFLSKWIHKSVSSVCKSANTCSCEQNLQE